MRKFLYYILAAIIGGLIILGIFLLSTFILVQLGILDDSNAYFSATLTLVAISALPKLFQRINKADKSNPFKKLINTFPKDVNYRRVAYLVIAFYIIAFTYCKLSGKYEILSINFRYVFDIMYQVVGTFLAIDRIIWLDKESGLLKP